MPENLLNYHLLNMFATYTYRIYSCFALLMLFASCSQTYKIEGTSSVAGIDGKKLFLKTLKDGEWVAVDSADVEHGLFKMSGPADTARMVALFITEENIMPLVLEKGKVELKIANGQLEAKGTPLNDRLYEFIRKRNDMEAAIGELDRKEARAILEGGDADEVHAQLEAEGTRLVKEMNDYVVQFISDNFTNVLGPSVFMMMCSTLPYPIITPTIEQLMKTAPMEFKADPMVKEILEKAKENKTLIEEQQRLQENVANHGTAGNGVAAQ